MEFADGTTGEVDATALIESADAGVFSSLRDDRVFGAVGVVHGAVTWPGNIDLAPDAMYADIRKTGRSILI